MTMTHDDAVRRLREVRARLLRPVSQGGRGLQPFEVAAAAGVSPQTMRQYCLAPETAGARRIPEERLKRLLAMDRHEWPATNEGRQS